MSPHSHRGRRPCGLAANPSPHQIRAVRESAGLTQVAAGDLVYRSERNWQQWEAGERRMDPALWELFRIKLHTAK